MHMGFAIIADIDCGSQLKEEFIQAADTKAPGENMDMFGDEDDAVPISRAPAATASDSAALPATTSAPPAATVMPSAELLGSNGHPGDNLRPPDPSLPTPIMSQVTLQSLSPSCSILSCSVGHQPMSE